MLMIVVIKRVDWALVTLNSNLAFSSFQVPEENHTIRGTTKDQATKYLREKDTECILKI